MTTTENSRADALTPCVHSDDPKACYRVRCQLGGKCADDDMSPRQPAAAPIDARNIPHRDAKLALCDAVLADTLNKNDPKSERAAQCAAAFKSSIECVTAPAPADERAAFRDALTLVGRGEGESSAELATIWSAAIAFEQSRAASANETGAEGPDALAHEVWSAAQRAPGEGIEDAVQRIAAILSRSPAMAAEAPAIPAGYALVPIEPTPEILTAIWQNERDSRRAWERAIATVQQPAQADARVGLTGEQRDAIDFVIGWYEQCSIADNPYREHIATLRALLAARPGTGD